MCLNPGLELLSTSRLGELSPSENDVSLNFLEKENKNFPGGTIRNMEKNRGMRLIEDNFQWSELNPRDKISRVSRDRKSEHPLSEGPDLCRVVFIAVEEVLHGFYFIASEASGFCSHA
jgi:hypothetical protein